MHKQLILISMLLALSACAKEGKLITDNVPNACGNKGYTWTGIHYGDSRLIVLPLSEIGAGYEWRFKLMPQSGSSGPVAFSDATVTVDADDADLDWLEVDGTFKNEGGQLEVCVPGDLEVGTPIKFNVTVTGVGMLDPRARVVR
ncbi:MAG TPA: hypothetical protein PKK10_17290 [Woeseiaceae bacterium]|nr:hypothetical protein [Woeseiaceae bacterium]